jgi:hypothetical protein
VNAYAANILTRQGIRVSQFTILDRPFGQGTRFDSLSSPVPFDADGPIFRSLLPLGDVVWVDNYYGNLQTALTPSTGASLLPAKAFNHLYEGADHPGVHAQYAATIPTTAPVTPNCPATGGFLCSVIGGGFGLRQAPDWDPRLSTNPFFTIDPFGVTATPLVDWLRLNCDLATDFNALCTEGSPAYLWKPDFRFDNTNLFLSFEFSWPSPGDGDWLTLHFGDRMLFSFIGASGDATFRRAFIPVGQFAGQTGQLVFALHSVGEKNASVQIRNVSLTKFLSAAISIKPGDPVGTVNTSGTGKIPVAVISTSTFNAPTQVDVASLTFGRTGDERSFIACGAPQDVNGDGVLDLVCQFDAQRVAFQLGDTVGTLKGRTLAGIPVVGIDSVRIKK